MARHGRRSMLDKGFARSDSEEYYMKILRIITASIVLLALADPFLNASAASLTPLWTFSGGTDGANPEPTLVQGSDSNFYGTTSSGSTHGRGTVFRLSP